MLGFDLRSRECASLTSPDHQVSVAAIDERVDENKDIVEYQEHGNDHRDRNTGRCNHRPLLRERRQSPPQDRGHNESAPIKNAMRAAVFAPFLES
ncbi:hypothetical protein BKP30_27720 [Rhodococcus erythropolis]|nr:hypothetical protein BKP30_27720 [Rhodococcus erythropolis]